MQLYRKLKKTIENVRFFLQVEIMEYQKNMNQLVWVIMILIACTE